MRILEVVGLTKRFAGLTVLDAVSFTAEEGEILGLFGPKGAGKTTCFHCLSGFATPDGGRIIFDGREVTGEPPHRLARAGIARTFQIARPFKSLTAAENVTVALGSWRGEEARRRALDLLERVGLGAEADRRAGLLTPGMLKRLEVARALALEPRLILLDEPLGGLSDAEMGAAARLIFDLRAGGLTVILVANQMRVAMGLVDRVVVLDHGAVIASGPPERLQSDPKVVEAYRGQVAASAENVRVRLTYVDAELAAAGRPKRWERVRFLVDSDAIYSLAPAPLLRRLGIRLLRHDQFELADGTTMRRSVGLALFRIGDKLGGSEVIFGAPRDEPLLGAVTLEALGLELDPVRRRLRRTRLLMAGFRDAPCWSALHRDVGAVRAERLAGVVARAPYQGQYRRDWLARSSAARYSRRASEPKGAGRHGLRACDRTDEVSSPRSRWPDTRRPRSPCP